MSKEGLVPAVLWHGRLACQSTQGRSSLRTWESFKIKRSARPSGVTGRATKGRGEQTAKVGRPTWAGPRGGHLYSCILGGYISTLKNFLYFTDRNLEL